MNEEQLEKLRIEWYKSDPVLFEIVKNLVGRETMFIGNFPIRNIKAHMIKYLISNFKRYQFYTAKMNLYNSLAKYQDMPVFSFEYHKRKAEQLEFNQNYRSYMVGYDFLFDIDCQEEPRFSYAVTWKIKEIFDKYKIPYYLLYSAGKNNGFHIRVDYEDLPESYKKMDHLSLCKLFKSFIHRVKTIHDLPFIDDTITDLRRVGKVPYGVVYPFYRICLPLSDDEFKDFDLNKVTLQYWIKNVHKIRNRGLIKREGDPENFKKLIDKYMED